MTAILIVHIAAVIVVAAANIGALTTTVLARRSTSPRRILTLLRVHNIFAARTLVPAAVVTLATGAWLTYRTGVSLLAPWMAGTLVLFVASALVGIIYLLPEESRAVAEAQRLVDAGESKVSKTLVRHTAAPGIVAGEWAAQLTMAVMFVLMIVQPS